MAEKSEKPKPANDEHGTVPAAVDANSSRPADGELADTDLAKVSGGMGPQNLGGSIVRRPWPFG